MAYQALYRKWRPLEFDDVQGQDAIVTTLKNQIKTGRIGHAYLFCGTRGTGKTSVAKIFARAVNCAHAAEHDGSPCNECQVCRSILSGSSMNVLEIDAASNNGVDNIRDIREQVEYPPTEGNYKVYIIDEVHMLSTGAFNALLKTLEEPPAYVIFILATTDPQKIPQTILSRCQRYDFRRIGTDVIVSRIHELAQAEHFEIEERAARYIARAADGSMRDSLSLLDQCLAFHYGQCLTYENVLDVLGAVDTGVFSRLYRAVCGHRTEEALRIVSEAVNTGREIGQFLNDFIWYMRNVLLAGSIGSEDLLDVSRENEELLLEDAKLADKTTLLYLMSSLSELSNRLRSTAQKRILLEVELIRLCTRGTAGAGRPAEPRSVPAGEDGRAQLDLGQFGEKTPVAAAERPAAGKPAAAEPPIVEVPAAEPPAPEAAAAAAAPEGDLLPLIRENWNALCQGLSPENRAVFLGTALRSEKPGAVTVVFQKSINYKIAATNRDENGLRRLSELVMERFGYSVSFFARTAKPGEFDETIRRVTDEDLLKIHFPVDIE